MVYSCVHSTEGKGVLPSAHSEETPGAEEKERDLLSTSLLLCSILHCWWCCICPSESNYYISKHKYLKADTNDFNHPPKCFKQVLALGQSPTAGESDHLC